MVNTVDMLGGILVGKLEQIKSIKKTNAKTKVGEILDSVLSKLDWDSETLISDKSLLYMWAHRLNDYNFTQSWTKVALSKPMHVRQFIKGFATQWNKRLS